MLFRSRVFFGFFIYRTFSKFAQNSALSLRSGVRRAFAMRRRRISRRKRRFFCFPGFAHKSLLYARGARLNAGCFRFFRLSAGIIFHFRRSSKSFRSCGNFRKAGAKQSVYFNMFCFFLRFACGLFYTKNPVFFICSEINAICKRIFILHRGNEKTRSFIEN